MARSKQEHFLLGNLPTREIVDRNLKRIRENPPVADKAKLRRDLEIAARWGTQADCRMLVDRLRMLVDPVKRVNRQVRLNKERDKLGVEWPLRDLLRAEKNWLRKIAVAETKLKKLRRRLRRERKKLHGQQSQS